MNTITVQWVGGPNDGKEFQVADTTRTIAVAINTQPTYLIDEIRHTDPITFKNVICSIYLTSSGYRVNWPY